MKNAKQIWKGVKEIISLKKTNLLFLVIVELHFFIAEQYWFQVNEHLHFKAFKCCKTYSNIKMNPAFMDFILRKSGHTVCLPYSGVASH